jgi:cytochrome b5
MVPPFTLYTKGKDATEAFEDVGHSEEARGLLPPMIVGEFEKGPNVNPTTTLNPSVEMYTPPQEVIAKAYQSQSAAAASMDNAVQQTSKFVPTALFRIPYSSDRFSVFYFVPLAALVAYFAWRFYS